MKVFLIKNKRGSYFLVLAEDRSSAICILKETFARQEDYSSCGESKWLSSSVDQSTKILARLEVDRQSTIKNMITLIDPFTS